MELPPNQRLSLVRAILSATEPDTEPDNEASEAWEDEIASRIQAIDSGTAKGSYWKDALKRIDRELAS